MKITKKQLQEMIQKETKRQLKEQREDDVQGWDDFEQQLGQLEIAISDALETTKDMALNNPDDDLVQDHTKSWQKFLEDLKTSFRKQARVRPFKTGRNS